MIFTSRARSLRASIPIVCGSSLMLLVNGAVNTAGTVKAKTAEKIGRFEASQNNRPTQTFTRMQKIEYFLNGNGRKYNRMLGKGAEQSKHTTFHMQPGVGTQTRTRSTVQSVRNARQSKFKIILCTIKCSAKKKKHKYLSKCVFNALTQSQD